MSGAYSSHPVLVGLDGEKLAELALMGLRYRALGAGSIDFSDPSRLDVYWTGTRMVEKVVKEAVKAAKGRSIDAEQKVGIAIGHLTGLFNCSVIDNDTYMAQFKLLLDRPR
ncbi:hypothetical protein IR012_03485 [Pseudomonas putida]|uniref:hypothetical protein n=1 Tax=Pseudomonas putida TaxID=303 RepID=UPI0018AAE343|nr:hypothetical protein [Pseudomonas putida]MBF8667991.1 hypothetical protein [Pseudomonas putida]MBF8711376.1 hypothetical protein [Pseudomonas putida]